MNFNPHSPCGERPRRRLRDRPNHRISIHTPLAGSDAVCDGVGDVSRISIHTPLAGSDVVVEAGGAAGGISIHTPLAGSDIPRRGWCRWCRYFNPHSPCGERLDSIFHPTRLTIFQSTLPLRGATRRRSGTAQRGHISIHTPLAGSDGAESAQSAGHVEISIHTPLAGSDTQIMRECVRLQKFQSTLPLRGATR